MSRCICCQRVLRDGELRKKKPDKTPEDMCTECISAALYPQYVEDKPLSVLTEWNVLSRQLFTTYKE